MATVKPEEVGHVELEDRIDHDDDLKQRLDGFDEVNYCHILKNEHALTILSMMRLDTGNTERALM